MNTVTHSTFLKGFVQSKQHERVMAFDDEMRDGNLYSTVLHSTVVLRSNGELQYPPECLNVDDCAPPPKTIACKM